VIAIELVGGADLAVGVTGVEPAEYVGEAGRVESFVARQHRRRIR
jgi:hypothetical protein